MIIWIMDSNISTTPVTQQSGMTTNQSTTSDFASSTVSGNSIANRLIACLENAMAKNSIEKDAISAFPGYSDLLLNTVTTHNSTCPESKISLP